MALRYSSTNQAIAVAGTTFAHGLTDAITGAAAAPTEWFFNHRTAIPGGADPLGGTIYLTAAPGTTSLVLASASGATTGDVFAAVVHTVVM